MRQYIHPKIVGEILTILEHFLSSRDRLTYLMCVGGEREELCHGAGCLELRGRDAHTRDHLLKPATGQPKQLKEFERAKGMEVNCIQRIMGGHRHPEGYDVMVR